MHFSIPEAQELSNGSELFTGFHIYINGNFHCCLRFKQLHNLHEQLKRSLPNLSLPQFPPKRLLTLTKIEIEQRRIALERYLQLVGQDPVLSKSNLLRTFLLNAQQESAFIETRETSIDVYITKEQKIAVDVTTNECSSRVLEKALKSINIPDHLIFYFALFLCRNDSNSGNVILIRKLMDFESPFISQKNADDCQILIRKNYWDYGYDLELMTDKTALDLLYIQSQSDVEKGWIVTNKEVEQNLTLLQSADKKIEYVKLVRQLPCYGYLQFLNVLCDFPEINQNATVLVGNRELCILVANGTATLETKFRVTRMRCWRVTTILNSKENNNLNCEENEKYSYELSFEYLMAKSCLKWVKLVTKQAMLISVCLQSMVDELLNQKSGGDINNINLNTSLDQELDYIKRDGNKMHLSSTNESTAKIMLHSKDKTATSSVFSKTLKNSVNNEAFENIGDDDL